MSLKSLRPSPSLHPNLTALNFNCSSSTPATHDPKWCQGCPPSPPTVPNAWVRTPEPRKAPASTLEDASWAPPAASTTPEEWPQRFYYHCPIFLGWVASCFSLIVPVVTSLIPVAAAEWEWSLGVLCSLQFLSWPSLRLPGPSMDIPLLRQILGTIPLE